MEKILAILAALILSLSASGNGPAVLPDDEWQRDLTSHWRLDESGAVTDLAPHTLDDMLLCSVCGSEIIDFGDGSGDVINYDAQDNIVRYTSFQADGSISYESLHQLTYDDNGHLTLDVEYVNGVLACETSYTVDADGFYPLPVKSTYYNDDGSFSVNDYDEHGNVIRSAIMEADGTVSYEAIGEFVLGEEGWYYEARNTASFADGTSFYTEYNQYGDMIRTINKEPDGTIWADDVYEYEYTEEGIRKGCKQYSFGVLVMESFCNSDGYIVKEIEYLEDGSTIVYEYDEEGNATETHYDAAGEPAA